MKKTLLLIITGLFLIFYKGTDKTASGYCYADETSQYCHASRTYHLYLKGGYTFTFTVPIDYPPTLK